MGRILKRVPLDFAWPLKERWHGYLNPYQSMMCPCCQGTGLNQRTKQLSDEWYSFDDAEWVYVSSERRYNNKAWSNHLTAYEVEALVHEGRLRDFTCTFIVGHGWVKKHPPYMPTAEEVNQWNRTGMGHDAINQWICVEARARRLGFYGVCDLCQGEGELWQSENLRHLHDDWTPMEPPAGEGFQLWETTSEGSPVSPVFETLEALCEFAAEHATTFGSHQTSAAEWHRMLKEDHVYHQEGQSVFI